MKHIHSTRTNTRSSASLLVHYKPWLEVFVSFYYCSEKRMPHPTLVHAGELEMNQFAFFANWLTKARWTYCLFPYRYFSNPKFWTLPLKNLGKCLGVRAVEVDTVEHAVYKDHLVGKVHKADVNGITHIDDQVASLLFSIFNRCRCYSCAGSFKGARHLPRAFLHLQLVHAFWGFEGSSQVLCTILGAVHSHKLAPADLAWFCEQIQE